MADPRARLAELIEKYDLRASNPSTRYARAKDVAADLHDLRRALAEAAAGDAQEWGFEAIVPGVKDGDLMYVTRNQLLAETMQAARPQVPLLTRSAATPWVEVNE
ncbi:MAG TPA: hypothetical protein VLI04_14835 [Nocardioidaceae bacterium]|nr:hypothetical protein [Nocardioidaceae bacterium]